LRQVGKGAMGLVFEAYQTKLRRKVALKVLSQEHADKAGFLERFKREAATGARITNRNVVRVYDLITGMSYDAQGTGTKVHIISMEYVDGPHLRRLSETEEPPLRDNITKAFSLFRQIAAGIAAAHELGIVHRDLKPENIMLDRDTGLLKVADFGLAYFIDRDAADAIWDTRTRMTMGTVAYMPPEQGKDAKRVVASGDVFSLGRILYELLIGSLPDGAFTAASKINSEIPQAVDAVIERCLQTKPEDRYQSASDLLEAFDAAVAHTGSESEATEIDEVDEDQRVEPIVERSPAVPAPVLRERAKPSSLSERYPLWLLVAAPLICGLLLGAWLFGNSNPQAPPGTVWLLDGADVRNISPHSVAPDYPQLSGGLWARGDRFLDHPGVAGRATVAQPEPAFAQGRELSLGKLNIERRVEWSLEGDSALRQSKLGSVHRWVAVGFTQGEQRSWVGIDGDGDCHVFEEGGSRPCGLGRPVVTPARINLRQVRDKIEITIDNQDVLPERLSAPKAPARLMLLCQNQHCRFDPKRR
jgi:serine/threonine protein kinase